MEEEGTGRKGVGAQRVLLSPTLTSGSNTELELSIPSAHVAIPPCP